MTAPTFLGHPPIAIGRSVTAPLLFGLMLVCLGRGHTAAAAPADPADGAPPADFGAPPADFIEAHCLDCHDAFGKSGGLDLETLVRRNVAAAPDRWEAVVRKLATRQMPPSDTPAPDESEYQAALETLTAVLDARARKQPRPGRTDSLRRLNRTEYQNAVRDLLAISVDAAKW